jgi:hypothetical protein
VHLCTIVHNHNYYYFSESDRLEGSTKFGSFVSGFHSPNYIISWVARYFGSWFPGVCRKVVGSSLAALCIHVLERRELFELFGIVLIRKLIRLSCVPKNESSVMSNLYFD